MRKNTLPRLAGRGWSHPYGHGPFAPFLYADGGDGDGTASSGNNSAGDTGQEAAGDRGGQASGQSAGQGQQSGQTTGQQADDQVGQADNGQDIKSLPPWAQKALSDARADAGKARTNAKQTAADEARNQMAQEIGKALGLVDNKKPADPAELTKTITEQTGRIGNLEGSVHSLSVELAAYKAAGKHDANPAALLDSRSFLKSVEGLDPSTKDFDTKVSEAIKKAVDDNQQLRAGQVPRRGGGEFTGGPGAREGRPASLSQALSRKFSG